MQLIKDIYQYHILESPCELVSHDSRRSLAGNVQKLKNLSSFFGMKCRVSFLLFLRFTLIWILIFEI